LIDNLEKVYLKIKDIIPERHWPDAAAKVEKNLNVLVFPTPATKIARYTKMVEGLVADIKVVRSRALKSIGTLTKKQKLRVLNQLIHNESEMAKSILNSPVPEGLNEAQLQEYKAGLAELAKEYELQSVEFTKARAELEGQFLKESDPETTLPEIQVDQWDMPRGPARDIALDLFAKISPTAALIYLDNLVIQKSLSEEDYHKIRAGVLLSMSHSEAMRKVIHDEFVGAKQLGLIEKWKGLIKK